MRWKGMFSRGFGPRPPPPSLIKGASFLLRAVELTRPSVGMDSKDAHESLESGGGGAGGGGGARCRCSNGRRTAAVFVIQSLLTAACAAFSLNMFFSQQPFPQDNGIFMQMLRLDSDELRFTAIWNKSVYLNNEKRVKLSCAGPYMVYLWACGESYETPTVANLTLKQGDKSFHLQTLRDGGCQEMQSIFMLNEREITLKVGLIEDQFKIKKLFLGLQYMLGSQCFKYPL
ncbi:uncharacterized protein LOC132107315 [Carassius carassius]|uniref:uncharacterized protein LOC132107315 n=1 Tax=Carassius carassius TaxID=217509 RepID=UPI002868645D|nr:uncharacterized protein LOC132107315 [Carassius carassius]